MSRLAIIPARGGSKRIPRKNIRSFCGAPIISYSIRAALDSGVFDEVMVSTEDEEIRDVARSFGATVPFLRSGNTASDHATTAAVVQEVLDEYQQLGRRFEQVMCLYPCAPLLKTETIIRSLDRLVSGRFDCVFTVSRYSSPIQRALVFKGQQISMLNPEYELTRSQDLETCYFDAGQLYWLNAEHFLINATLRPPNSSAEVIDDLFVQDIDTPEDWELAEVKYQYLKSKGYL